jgi:Protein of unknown function (DUF541)
VRKIVFSGVMLALVAMMLGAAACGDDDDDDGGGQTSEIRTNQGLSVAALAAELSGGGIGDGAEDDADLQGITAPETDAEIARSSFGKDIAPYGGFTAQAGSYEGITVIGYGSATAAADSAIIEFYFGRGGGGGGVEPQPAPVPEDQPNTEPGTSGDGSSGSSGADSADGVTIEPAAPDSPVSDENVNLQEVAPITEAELQPVIDALVNAGVPRENIEFIEQGYRDPFFASATIRASGVGVGSVDAAVQAATTAAAGLADIQLQSSNVSYTVSDCSALERSAIEAAVQDANERGTLLAEVLGVGRGAIVGAANHSYSAYGGTPCGGGYSGPIPLAEIAYTAGQASEVQVVAEISVTFAIN